jgi:TetR/AcrR family transcriptional repressor of nem operon
LESRSVTTREAAKAESRERIVKAARRRFKLHGYKGANIDDIMREAGLTRGTFYAHFANKDALFAEVFRDDRFFTMLESLPSGDAAGALAKLEWYLSQEHRDILEWGCPTAALAQDAPRRGPQVQAALEKALERFIADVAAHLPDENPDVARTKASAAVALAVGGLMLSRGVGAKSKLSEELLAACRTVEARLFDGED